MGFFEKLLYGFAEGKGFYNDLLHEEHFDPSKFARQISAEWTTIGVVSGFLAGFSFTGLLSSPVQIFDDSFGVSASVMLQIYSGFMIGSTVANLVSVLCSMQLYVFMNAVPQYPYYQEKFIRRFILFFPVPRLALLVGASLFITGLFCLSALLLQRLPAIIVGCTIGVTGIGMLLFFNYLRRVQRGNTYRTWKPKNMVSSPPDTAAIRKASKQALTDTVEVDEQPKGLSLA